MVSFKCGHEIELDTSDKENRKALREKESELSFLYGTEMELFFLISASDLYLFFYSLFASIITIGFEKFSEGNYWIVSFKKINFLLSVGWIKSLEQQIFEQHSITFLVYWL